jgi:hypothetical protein
MFENNITTTRLGRSRIWNDVLKPHTPMKPEKPNDLLGDLLDHLLHPRRCMRRQLDGEGDWPGAPWRLWVVLAFIAVAGSLLYGASLVIVLPAGDGWFAALALATSAGFGWILFGVVAIALIRKSAPHLTHACLVTMLFGEAVLEIGVLGNFVMWLIGPVSIFAALAFNIALIAVSNIVMLAVLAAQLRELKVRPALTAALWLGILNPAGLAAFRLFYPTLFPF